MRIDKEKLLERTHSPLRAMSGVPHLDGSINGRQPIVIYDRIELGQRLELGNSQSKDARTFVGTYPVRSRRRGLHGP